MDFKKTTFVKTVVALQERPPFVLPEIVLVGRSNVGKSSLINALCEQSKLSKVSSIPGKTRHLNYFQVDQSLYLVDAPGFGYTAYGGKDLSRFGMLMEDYFQKNEMLKGCLYLVDSRRLWTEEDQDFIRFIQEQKKKILVVWTKIDLLNQSQKALLATKMQSLKKWDLAQLGYHEKDKNALTAIKKWMTDLLD